MLVLVAAFILLGACRGATPAPAPPPRAASFAFDALLSPVAPTAAPPLDKQPWFRCVGSGHAALTLRGDWRAHMAQAARELGFRSVRFHGLLDDDMGPVVVRAAGAAASSSPSAAAGAAPAPRDAPAHYSYNFSGIDASLDWLVREARVAPYIELSFMPTALASNPRATYMHYKAVVSPPARLAAWADLMAALGAHWLARYGAAEVLGWRLEV